MIKSRIPEFTETLRLMHEIHIKKNADYTPEDNPFFNFDFTKMVLHFFKDERDIPFIVPIATKLARLSVLLEKQTKPNNESIQDSLVDIANYIILWKCDISRRRV